MTPETAQIVAPPNSSGKKERQRIAKRKYLDSAYGKAKSREYAAAYRKKYPEKTAAQLKAWRASPAGLRLLAKSKAHHKWLIRILGAYKRLEGCTDCGYRERDEALQFDHITGDKKFQLTDCGNATWPTIINEMNKCAVRCANCHAIRTTKCHREAAARARGDCSQ